MFLQLLTFLLKMKGSMVSGRTLQLVLYLCRYVEQGPGSDYLYSAAAFRSLLCNLEVSERTLGCYLGCYCVLCFGFRLVTL